MNTLLYYENSAVVVFFLLIVHLIDVSLLLLITCLIFIFHNYLFVYSIWTWMMLSIGSMHLLRFVTRSVSHSVFGSQQQRQRETSCRSIIHLWADLRSNNKNLQQVSIRKTDRQNQENQENQQSSKRDRGQRWQPGLSGHNQSRFIEQSDLSVWDFCLSPPPSFLIYLLLSFSTSSFLPLPLNTGGICRL